MRDRAVPSLRRDVDAVAKRTLLPICLAYIDLNRFKQVNDREGHAAGDQVLVALAAALQTATRAADIPARFGGDEFCIVVPRTDLSQARPALERIAREFDGRNPRDVSLSVGVAQTGPDAFAAAAQFIERADALMCAAKALAHTRPGHHIQFADGTAAALPTGARST